jgi:hypothetical protein
LKSSILAVLVVFCALLLAGCWNGRIYYSFEQPFWSSIGGETRLVAGFAGSAAVRGYLPRIDVSPAGTEPLARLLGNMSTGSYTCVIVGPLLSFQWAEFVRRFPDTWFVLIDAPAPPGEVPPNAVFLTFDRTAAFRDAGRAAGASVRARFGAEDTSQLGARIAILASDQSDLSAPEVDAFTRGAADALDGGRPAARSLPAASDKTAIKAAVDQMRRGGAEIFLLGLGENDPVGLEAVRDAGGSAVVADWQSSGAFADQVLFAVEDDMPGGITRALDSLRSGVVRVQGPVRLVRGKKI